MVPLAAQTQPAGGAEITQVIIATGGATIATAILLWLIMSYRSGRASLLGSAAAFSERVSGLPGWAALPAGLGGVSLITALFGMYWDISLHIDNGRDAGPLANPAHYFILAGLFGVLASGILAMALPAKGERPGPRPLKVTRDWYAPVGGVLMAACGAFSLIGFPLDDVWHRLFGQDVTLWGPTHLMLLGGAAMTLVSQAVLLTEGMRAKPDAGTSIPRVITAVRRVALGGGLLVALSIFEAEADFGVSQFQLVFHPLLVALAASVALVAARLWIGPGAAIGIVAFYLVVRGGVSVMVGPVLGQSFPSLPLFVPEAILVELAALAYAKRSPLAFGALAGVLIGTLGFAGEYAWTQVAFQLPWTTDLLPEGVIVAVITGVAGGLTGALLGSGLRGELPSSRVTRSLVAGSWLAIAACLGWGLITETPKDASVSVTLTEASPGPKRTVNAEVRVDPKLIEGEPAWVTMTAWQGRGLHVDHLRRVAPGVYRTTEPAPVHGEWKTIVRIHDGRKVIGAPVFMPLDTAIPAPEVPATKSFTRPLVRDTDILQREKRQDVAGWLWTGSTIIVGLLYLAFLAANALGVGRIGRALAARRAEQAPAVATGAPPRETVAV